MNTIALIGLSLAFAALLLIIGLQIAFYWFKMPDRIKNQQEIIRLLKKVAGEQ